MSEFKVGDRVVDEDGDVCRIEKIEGGHMHHLLCRPDGPNSFLYWHAGPDGLLPLEKEAISRQFKVGDRCLDWEDDPCEVTEVTPRTVRVWYSSIGGRPADSGTVIYYEQLEPGASHFRTGKPWLRLIARDAQEQTFHKDAGKPDPTLIPSAALMQVVSVFEHGLEKGYEPRSWRQVPDAQARYLKSLARHFQAVLKAYQDAEESGVMVLDSDGGRPHLAAIAADALILLDLGLRGEGK